VLQPSRKRGVPGGRIPPCWSQHGNFSSPVCHAPFLLSAAVIRVGSSSLSSLWHSCCSGRSL
jgi:hypothetical protein